MISADQIRKAVEDFLADSDANKFALQFASLSHDIHKNGDSDAIELARKIQSRLADVSAKLMGPSDLKVALREDIAPPISGAYIRSPRFYTGSSANLATLSLVPNWGQAEGSSVRFANRPPSLVYGS
jgi:hypothetical protein